MPDSTSAEDTVIRIAALKAARDAADHMVRTSVQKNSNSVGAFALYTWGSLAFVSAIFAAVIGFSPTNIAPDSIRLAENRPALKQPVRKFDAPSKAAEVKIADKPVEVLVKLEKPVLPEVKLPKIKLVETRQEFAIDTQSTGSVAAHQQQDLQPFPEDPLPEILFGVDIGGAKSASPLIQRFAALKRRAPDLFQELEPRLQVKGQGQSLEARLIAGPFTSRSDVAHFCRAVRLRLTVDCTLSTFEGQSFQ